MLFIRQCVCVCDAAVNALYMWLLSVSAFACGDHHKRLPYANIIVTFSKRKRQYFDGQGLPWHLIARHLLYCVRRSPIFRGQEIHTSICVPAEAFRQQNGMFLLHLLCYWGYARLYRLTRTNIAFNDVEPSSGFWAEKLVTSYGMVIKMRKKKQSKISSIVHRPNVPKFIWNLFFNND